MTTAYNLRAEVLIEIDAAGFFHDESVNWRWCDENATFVHRGACEFIVHVGSADSFPRRTVDSMRDFGCTDDFIQAYSGAAALGATRVLFYA